MQRVRRAGKNAIGANVLATQAPRSEKHSFGAKHREKFNHCLTRELCDISITFTPDFSNKKVFVPLFRVLVRSM